MDQLDAEAQRRLHANPLRILDTKNPAMQDLVNAAPQLLDYLGEESLAHFDGLKRILDANNIQYTVNPRLVRGLDYYNRTVFEWVTDALGAQGTVCAGGRYDPLIEMVGGKPTPGIGFAMGMERLIELMKAQGEPAAPSQCDVYLVHQGEASPAESLRPGRAHPRRRPGRGACTAPPRKARQLQEPDEEGRRLRRGLRRHHRRGRTDERRGGGQVAARSGRRGRQQQASVAFDAAVDYLVDQITGGHDHDHDHEHVHYHP